MRISIILPTSYLYILCGRKICSSESNSQKCLPLIAFCIKMAKTFVKMFYTSDILIYVISAVQIVEVIELLGILMNQNMYHASVTDSTSFSITTMHVQLENPSSHVTLCTTSICGAYKIKLNYTWNNALYFTILFFFFPNIM